MDGPTPPEAGPFGRRTRENFPAHAQASNTRSVTIDPKPGSAGSVEVSVLY